MVAPLFAELVAAVEANPVGISPHYLAALVRLRDQIDHAPPLEVVDVVRLVIPFGNYAATMGAALRSDCSPALFDAIAKGLQALAEELDADAPATAEVLHQIGDEVLELSRNTPAGRSPQV